MTPSPNFENILPPPGIGEEIGTWMADRALIYRQHYTKFGSYPNLENPTTFSEKIHYRKLYDRRPILTLFADKIKVRDYVASRIGTKYLTKIYQIAATPEGIDWYNLPPRYFVKANHGSGWNLLIYWDTHEYDELFLHWVTVLLNRWLQTDYSSYAGEHCYHDISPLLYVEEDLGTAQERPIDWKFHVFDGKAAYLEVHQEHFCNFYDRDLNLLKVKQHQDNFSTPMYFPPNMHEMFAVADQLGQGIDYVRVDLYNINGRIVFGELTNYPHAGLVPFDPQEFDAHLGSLWTLHR